MSQAEDWIEEMKTNRGIYCPGLNAQYKTYSGKSYKESTLW